MLKRFTSIDILRYCVFFIFIGRAYQFIFFDVPFRSFFWDESLLSPIVENVFQITWFEYATSLKVDFWINNLSMFCGLLLIIASISALLWNKIQSEKVKKNLIKIGIIILLILTILIFKSRNFRSIGGF